MIGRLIRGLFSLLLYFSLATLIAEAIVLAYLVLQWQLDGDRVVQMIAAAKGMLPVAAPAPLPANPETTTSEQVSFEQILEARALKDKNLQVRELALSNALAQLRAEQRKLADDERYYRQQRTDYETRLAAMSQGAKATGREEVSRVLQTIKPRQAKEILQQMLDNKETEEVVMLITGMADTKRAKILGEFKTAEETKKIDDVLRLIRNGTPQGPEADRAKQQIQQPPAAGQ